MNCGIQRVRSLNLLGRQVDHWLAFGWKVLLLLDFCATGLVLRIRWFLFGASPLAPELVPGRAIGPAMLANPSHDVSRGRVLDVESCTRFADAHAMLLDQIDELVALLARGLGVELSLLPVPRLEHVLKLL